MFKKNLLIAFAMTTVCAESFAGGLLTNTNASVAYARNPAMDGGINIYGVYSNPAGVAFLPKGLHLSVNIQNVYQERTIRSGMTVPALQGTPFYHPLTLNGANADGVKYYKGEASAPILPSFQAALNYDRWGFQLGFSLNGGGGKCTFSNGLGSFERIIALAPVLLAKSGLTSNTPGYKVENYMKGQQYVFGLQFGSTYKINEHMAVYGGVRFNYVFNKYKGNILNITANIDGTDQNLYNYFGQAAGQYAQLALLYESQASQATDPATKAKLEAASAQAKAGAEKLEATRTLFADRYVDCTQTGWALCPIIGFDYNNGPWNFSTRLEFTTHFNIENDTKRDDTGLFADGVNTPGDMPGLFSIAGEYKVLPNVRIDAAYHYYFDKDAKMDKDKQKLLGGNTMEYMAGAEWDITKHITVSGGYQRTQYNLGDGSYLNDMSFVTSSNSVGVGVKFSIAKNMSVNLAYFRTFYEKKTKTYTEDYSLGGTTITAENTDQFHRTNKVLGASLDIDF